jgi:hypothetical protein
LNRSDDLNHSVPNCENQGRNGEKDDHDLIGLANSGQSNQCSYATSAVLLRRSGDHRTQFLAWLENATILGGTSAGAPVFGLRPMRAFR